MKSEKTASSDVTYGNVGWDRKLQVYENNLGVWSYKVSLTQTSVICYSFLLGASDWRLH